MDSLNTTKTLDVKGLKCPMPIVKAKKALDTMTPGETLAVVATDKGSVLDFQGWSKTNKAARLLDQQSIKTEDGSELYVHIIERQG
ncbi:sulfurtransferase TusA family protein [bacterium]|nr:sulfurtransferase TusA family protein [bacterium]